MDIALQVRRNADEQREALKDLMNWEKEIKQKDRGYLRKDSGTVASNATVPPIRNSGKMATCASSPSATLASPSMVATESTLDKRGKVKRISAYDYRAWDKFDPDKEENEVDAKKESNENEKKDSKTLEKEFADENIIEMALIRKEKGNEYFKKGEWKRALKQYTSSIALDPTQAVPYVNRAMVHLKLESWQKAEEDCTSGLALEPKNVKALWRRGVARSNMGQFLDAEADFQNALVLDPKNATVREELAKVRARIAGTAKSTPTSSERVKKTPSVSLKGSTQTAMASADVIPPPQVTPVKRRTIPIREYTETAPEATKKNVLTIIPCESEIAVETSKQEKVTMSPQPTQPAMKKILIEELPSPNSKLELLETESKTVLMKEKVPARSPPRVTEAEKTPTTMFDFERLCREMKSDEESLYELIKAMDPTGFKSLFKSSLESRHLQLFISILERRFGGDSGETVCAILKGLTDINRFDTIALFMSKTDKAALAKIFSRLDDKVGKEQLDELRKKFRT
ncbi:RNA polymerase II-associated protein 3 [Phlyctochytrium planicorne]|nr:RNA polymerase II-associated protein 3 [Phlyctochytrium planicorne]